MKVEKTDLNGVLLITPPTVYRDYRGIYVETYNEKMYTENGIKVKFIQDDISSSKRGVLRGIHGDSETWKLVSCIHGEFFLVVVNNDPDSEQYKTSTSFTLSASDPKQVLIPPKFGNGHYVLSETAIFHYKQNTLYNRDGQFTIPWNSKEHNIFWPIEDPLTSIRDYKQE
ncbi:dTDP-4-dehydrorhamnose 3,5-epimerase family protein [Paracoccaceae bacterium]|nr:dTDP-4-dehydrorhamnose 3,5-epimerase family protein [Paracoccaceae bacterium]